MGMSHRLRISKLWGRCVSWSFSCKVVDSTPAVHRLKINPRVRTSSSTKEKKGGKRPQQYAGTKTERPDPWGQSETALRVQESYKLGLTSYEQARIRKHR